MGFLKSLITGRPDPVVAFATSIDSGVLYGTPTLDDYIFRSGRITRAEALRVPAVKRARDLICGEIGQFPIKVYDPNGKPSTDFSPSLFPQAEAGIARSVTWTRVVEDMLLYERAWLRVTSVGWHGKPAEAVRLEADTVTVQPEVKYYPGGSAKVWPDVPGLIRIDSPNGGILDAAPAVRACIALERATLNYVDGSPPIDYFTPADPEVDPFDTDDEAVEFLDKVNATRRERGTAYYPAAIKYNVGGWDPQKLQLREAREFAITEVARLTGIDAEELSVPTTSRTYFNAQDRRRARIEDVLGPYMSAIEGRLSMSDVTPRGWTVAFDTTSFLRLDDLAAAQADSVLVAAKILRPEEAREKRGLDPALTPTDAADPAAVGSAIANNAAIAAAHQEARRG